MKYSLDNICSFRKDKIDVLSLTIENYISTENMLPNKAGVITASSLPTVTQTQRYTKGDVLVSNIRPYFKKIWFADREGGCSNDVLVFKSKENVDKRYLYYVLASDEFFDYSMATSKGTKMPRGDKTSIMAYEINEFDVETQRKIGGVLSTVDEKISLNEKINKNLYDQAVAIFDNCFPDINIGEHTVGEFITPKRGKSLLSKDAISGNVPVVAGGLEPATYHNIGNTSAPVVTISASGANAGYINLWQIPVWSSDSSFIDSTMTDDVFFWYVLLKKRQQEIFDAQTGSAQPHIYPQHISNLPLGDLDNAQITAYSEMVKPLFELVGHNLEENKRLSSTRDTLLPKLMSGEIDVSDLSI